MTTSKRAKLYIFGGIIALYALTFQFSTFTVPRSSMVPTVPEGSWAVVYKARYGISTYNVIPFIPQLFPVERFITWSKPNCGDIVVFEHKELTGSASSEVRPVPYMKRCVAIAGQTVSLKQGMIYVDGNQVDVQPHFDSTLSPTDIARIDESTRRLTFPRDADYTALNWGPMRVPATGDTISLSNMNFQSWAPLISGEGHVVNTTELTIDGRSADKYVVKRDYVFVTGDNTLNSLDSRFWGFVAEDVIIGKVFLVI